MPDILDLTLIAGAKTDERMKELIAMGLPQQRIAIHVWTTA